MDDPQVPPPLKDIRRFLNMRSEVHMGGISLSLFLLDAALQLCTNGQGKTSLGLVDGDLGPEISHKLMLKFCFDYSSETLHCGASPLIGCFVMFSL